ncbi:UDP-N-acetylglucosamine 2-epimerase [Sulfurimonas denitrificans DSM 1251]|jgi:UDP-GlcNAc3NAcA epimerase|uniref:UDP-N-acetylglucosamine 2-epimerase n=1 Tax=Sulfurimonas denitrificans (strain ATCC 33889 / DSM 1251) TaxID=326298 RepID=Q30QN6_SULDN|nr:UDP-N-acetylglucosamine 2-epimerase (non-hydrolyzing) [Sulfurimonas denitrificans]ABB44695.1 UDP-N-acetylglucosamine 2-epimerase [Sulfurimonas denitrificans DSM 1251]MDD3442827.1 UDP-N-acetylglucosamine 2-epimerase (non-hydrolyzing) [Sulfurimonas denitrificans]
MKILTILGARPQFIKAGSVSREIAKHKEIKEIIVHTGQHYDANMSDIFFKEMQIPKPEYFLGIGGKSHGAMTGQMIEKIEEVALEVKPDWIMVYGDTNSTLAGAIVASKLHIKLAHVEAGLRSFNMKMPEEINRILTDRVSNILFCPTDIAVQNLKNEGFENFTCKIVKSGDVMQDGAIFYKNLAVKPVCDIKDDFILCTIHRAENTDDETRLKSIFEALSEIAKERQIILPLHPRTKKIVEDLKLNTQNLTLLDPVGYLEMVWLIDNCSLVMTDSGGVQKEAYFFEKPCITLRDETEWLELVECGVNTLAGADKEKIVEAYKSNLKFKIIYPQKLDLYGSCASEKIIIELLSYE